MAAFKIAHTGSLTSPRIKAKSPKDKTHRQVAKVGHPASFCVKNKLTKGSKRYVAQVGRLTPPITIQSEEPEPHPAIRSDKSQARGKRSPVTKSLE